MVNDLVSREIAFLSCNSPLEFAYMASAKVLACFKRSEAKLCWDAFVTISLVERQLSVFLLDEHSSEISCSMPAFNSVF